MLMHRQWSCLIAMAIFPVLCAAYESRATFDTEFVHIKPEKTNKSEIGGCTLPLDDFYISKYELTNTEYANFLNAVSRYSDPFHLYTTLQESHFWGGIIRLKTEAGFFYKVKKGYEYLPATFISWFDAARYVNWLHFGRPNKGVSEIGTTEGNKFIGAYDTSNSRNSSKALSRNPFAEFFLPTCGEWLYAGFYDPKDRKFTKYVGGDSMPISGVSGYKERTANYFSREWATPYPHLAAVTAYANNKSALGIFNQAGNVMEWVESDVRTVLGGSLFLPGDTLSITYRDSEFPNKKLSSFGFRVAKKSLSGTHKDLHFSAEIMDAPRFEDRSDSFNMKLLPLKWTRVDQPGNISDILTGRGCVPYEYEISTGEITNAQFSDFLNSVANIADSHNIYTRSMSTGVNGGILRKKNGNIFQYEPREGFENRPVAYLSWFALARYANWLHYGRPTGLQILGVTEGDSMQGAYDTSKFDEFENGDSKVNLLIDSFRRNKDAKYFIPTDDEWYKAAYYDPEKNGFRKYWKFPNRSDLSPTNLKKDNAGLNYQIDDLGEGPPFFVSKVGDFTGTGYYKIFDMGGNVWEWLEDWRNLGGGQCWRCELPTKGLRGGSFNYIDIGLMNGNVDPGVPSDRYFVYGGRLARKVDSKLTGWCTSSHVRYTINGWAKEVVRYKDISEGKIVYFSIFLLIYFVVLFIRKFTK